MFTPAQPHDPRVTATNPVAPIASMPLLLLFADSLEGLRQRLNDVALYHDFGCTYAGCQKTAETEATFLMRFLADVAKVQSSSDPPGTASLTNDVSAARTLP